MIKRAVGFIKKHGYILISSVGTSNWEIITACAVTERVHLKLIIPPIETSDFELNCRHISRQFELNSKITDLVELRLSKDELLREQIWKRRDEIIVNQVDVIMPVSIRKSGHLCKLIEQAHTVGKEIVDDFNIPYITTSPKLSYKVTANELTNSVKEISDSYIIHWTRTSNGPWPNERSIDFYRDVLESDGYPRDAYRTLRNIVIKGKIFGTDRNMPGKTKAVSFSGLVPVDAIKLMRWRARYRQMSFEPFGIGIEKQTALSLGVQPVVYINTRENVKFGEPKWLLQSIGQKTDWRHEKEYRYKGDFDLAQIPNDKLIAICRFCKQAQLFKKEFGINTVWYCD